MTLYGNMIGGKPMKKILSIVLAVIITAIGVLPCFAADGSCTCGQTPIIYVAALGSGSVYLDEGTANEKTLFRPDIAELLPEFAPLVPANTIYSLERRHN